MSEPNVRSNIGLHWQADGEKWIIQGHIGSTRQDGQYVRTRDLDKVKPAFQDLLDRMRTDYIDLGNDSFLWMRAAEFQSIIHGEFMEYVRGLKDRGLSAISV